MRRELELTRDLHAPRVARGALVRWYGGRLNDEELEAAELIVTELASNAVVHGVGRIVLASELDEDRLLIEVVDEGSGFEHAVREVPFDALSGRGLAIIAETSSRWGVHEGTTHVWAEIERKRRTRSPRVRRDPNECA